jgi:hypothetical protein
LKRWAYLALAIALAASSFHFLNETGQGAYPAPSPSPTFVASRDYPVINLSGTNSKVSRPANLVMGSYSYSWEATGAGPFVIYTVGAISDRPLVSLTLPSPGNESSPGGPSQGTGEFGSIDASIVIHVEASHATWTLHITPAW